MATVSVQIRRDTKEVDRLFRGLKGVGDKVITRALNRVIRSVQSAAVKEVASDAGIKQKDARAAMTIVAARYKRKSASVVVTGRRLPIIALAARQTKAGVTYKAGKAGRKLIPHAFIATMRSGHRGAFARIKKSRLPITELHGPSLPRVFAQSAVQRALDQVAESRWNTEIDQSIRYELSRMR